MSPSKEDDTATGRSVRTLILSVVSLLGAIASMLVSVPAAATSAIADGVTDLSLTVSAASTPVGLTSVTFDAIPAAGVPERTAATETAPIGRAPIGRAPIGRAPIGRAPIGRAPIGRAPIGRAPIGRAPLLDASLSSFPLLREGGWTAVLAHTCQFSNRDGSTCPRSVENEMATATPQSVTWNELLRDPFATDSDPTTLPELDPGSPDAIRLNEIVWALSPIRDATFLSFMLGTVTWDEVAPPGAGWCSEWEAISHPCSAASLAASIFETEAAGLRVDLTSLPDRPLASVEEPSRTLLWATQIKDTPNLAGSAIGDVRFSQIANLAHVVDCSGGYCDVPSTTLRRALADGRILPAAEFADLGLQALGSMSLSQIEYAFIDPAAIDWENIPLRDIRFEQLPAGSPTTSVSYTLAYTIACADASEMSAAVDLPDGFRYRPGSSRLAGAGAVSDPVFEPADDRDGALVWDLSSQPCDGATRPVELRFDAMPGFTLGTFASTARVDTATTAASTGPTAPITVDRDGGGHAGPGAARQVTAGSLVVGHLAGPDDRAYYEFVVPPGHEVSVSLMHPNSDVDLVLYAPDDTAVAPVLRQATPEPVTFGKGTATGPPTAHPDDALPPEPLQDVPIEPGRVVAAVSSLRGHETETVSVTARGAASSSRTYIAQVSTADPDPGPEPFVVTIRTSSPLTLPGCPEREFPFAAIPPVAPLPPLIHEGTRDLIVLHSARLAATFGAGDAAAVIREVQGMVAASDGLGIDAAIVDLALFDSVGPAFRAADANPCSPELNDAVVRAINDVVDGLRDPLGRTPSGFRSITIIGDDDLIPHARIPDTTTIGNERWFAGDAFFAADDSGTLYGNQYASAFAQGWYLSDAPYGSFQPLSIFGQTVYPMQVAVGRLGGSASTIIGAMRRFVASGGRADPRTATSDPRLGLVTDYDFAADGGAAVEERMRSAAIDHVDRLTGSWTKEAFRHALLENAPHLISANAHFDQYRLLPGAGDAGTWTEDDLFTTADLDAAGPDALRLRVLFGIGCHFGLDIPDRLASNDADAPRTRDWAQAASELGAAALIGSLGFGYGDTATVGFAEQLMANLAEHLVGGGTIGEALTRAEQDYLLSMGSFSPYDIKTLQQTILWGIPMYRMPGDGSSPDPGSGADPVSRPGFEGLTVHVTPSFERVTVPGGSFDRTRSADVRCDPSIAGCAAEPDVGVQATHAYPLVPRVITRLPLVAGMTARGAVMLGVPVGDPIATSTSRTEISDASTDVAFANATIDDSTIDQVDHVPGIYPATPQAITSFVRKDATTIDQRLVILPGQFRSGGDPSRPDVGTLRRFTTSSWFVTYSDHDDVTPPQILAVEGTPVDGRTAFAVTVRDPGNGDQQPVERVIVDALPLGGPDANVYRMLDLRPDPTRPGTWIGAMPFNVREFVVYVVDNHGNVGSATNGGAAYDATDETPPDVRFTIGTPKVDVGGRSVIRATTPVTVRVTDAGTGVATCSISMQGPVTASRACTSGETTFTLPATSGTYVVEVTATDAAGNERVDTTVLEVDETPPEISILSPEATAYELGQPLTASYACRDGAAGVASCDGSAPDGATLSTSTIGARAFSVTARDRLGNLGARSLTYSVGYGVCLLYDPAQPVKLTTSTVPIKLTICDRSTGRNLSSASVTVTATRLVRVTGGEEVAATLDPNAGTGTSTFRFDARLAVGGGYIYNVQTKNLVASSVYRLYFTVSGEPQRPDGSVLEHVAPILTR